MRRPNGAKRPKTNGRGGSTPTKPSFPSWPLNSSKQRLEVRVEGDVEDLVPTFEVGEKAATRVASGEVLNVLAKKFPQLIGGSADLAGSNNTTLEGLPFLSKDDLSARNIHFGVREHGMATIANGLSLHGGLKPYVGTFLIFSDYLRPALRLSALMDQPVVYVFTHDSIGLGGDGPTHQPVAALTALRAIPHLTVIRPADGNETAQAWAYAMTSKHPVAFALSRQGLPHLDVPKGSVKKGAYAISDSDGTPDLILIGTGSEVSLCLEAKKLLEKDGTNVRVVSMPSTEIFEAQDDSLPRIGVAQMRCVNASRSRRARRSVGLSMWVWTARRSVWTVSANPPTAMW